MSKKENKGGILNNEQVEQDLNVKGRTGDNAKTYTGSQDTGDKEVRQMGNDVQQRDGRAAADQNGEN